jgi:hypothetical protein
MIVSFKELNDLLKRVDRNLLFYTMCQLDPEMRAKYDKLDEDELRQVGTYESCRESIDRSINNEFKRLVVRQDGAVFISNEAASNIHTHAIEGIEANFLDAGVSALRRLKKVLVKYGQDKVLQLLESYFASLPDSLMCVRNAKQSGLAFPRNDAERSERTGYARKVMGALEEVDPDSVGFCIDASEKIIFQHNDLLLGSVVMQKLNERLMEMCLRPTISIDSAERSDSVVDPRKRDYAMLLLQMEELEMRFAHVQRRGEGLFASMSGDDLFEVLDLESLCLDEIRQEIGTERDGSEGVLSSLSDKEKGLASILLTVAMKGPRHLEMARSYAKTYSAEIKSKVFGNRVNIPEFSERDGYVIVADPRKLVFLDRGQLADFGFAGKALADFHERNYGIVSTYVIYKTPPTLHPSDAPLPPSVEMHRGKLYHAEMIRVIDIEDADNMPKELVRATGNGDSGNPDNVQEVLAELELPTGSGQVRLRWDVYFNRELKYRKSEMSYRRDAKGIVPDYDITPIGQDSGIHRTVKKLAIDNPNTKFMQRGQFKHALGYSQR